MEEMSGAERGTKKNQEMLGSVLVSGWSSEWKRRTAGAKSRFISFIAFWFRTERESSLLAVLYTFPLWSHRGYTTPEQQKKRWYYSIAFHV